MQHAIAYGVIHEPKITIGIQALHFWPGSSCWKPWIIHINWFDIVKNDTEDGYLRTSPFDAHGNYMYRYPNKKPRSRNSKIQHTEIRSFPSLQTDHDHDDDSSVESSDTLDEHLTEPNGRKLSFRECYHLACDRNSICVCMGYDLCDSEPQDKPKNPTSESTKSIETNKTPVQVKKKPIDYSQYCTHSSCHPRKTVHDIEPKSLPLSTTTLPELF